MKRNQGSRIHRLRITLTLLVYAFAVLAQTRAALTNAVNVPSGTVALAANPLPPPNQLVDAGDLYFIEKQQKVALLRAVAEVGICPSGASTAQQAVQQLPNFAGLPASRILASIHVGVPRTEVHIIAAVDPSQTNLEPRTVAVSDDIAWAYPVLVEPHTKKRMIPTDQVIAQLRGGEAIAEVDDFIRQAGFVVVGPAGPANWNTYLLRLAKPKEQDPLVASRTLANDARFLWATPSFVFEMSFHFKPNDPLFANQQYLNNTGQNGAKPGADVAATNAWDITRGTNSIVIAIIDSGVDTEHPDLRTQIWRNPGETGGGREFNGIDDDGNGYTDDYRGWDFYFGNNNPNPGLSPGGAHGTGCAGVAAAAGNNNTNISGIAPGCRILPIKIQDDSGLGFATEGILGNAINYAARYADIISCSWGGPGPPQMLVNLAISNAVSTGRSGKGTAVFCSSGNYASRWLYGGGPRRVQVPFGLGFGEYRFYFVYQRNTADGTVQIDNVRLLDSDGVETAPELFSTENFEGAFPPAGWVVQNSLGSSSYNWIKSNRDPYRGTGGGNSAEILAFAPFGAPYSSTLISPPTILFGGELLAFAQYFYLPANGAFFGVDLYDSSGNFVVRLSPLETAQTMTPITSLLWPAASSYAIAVGASTDQDVRADYSEYADSTYSGGHALDFLAPSGGGWSDVVTLDTSGLAAGASPTDFRGDFGGTSSACPVAAGIGALVLSVNPELMVSEVRSLMQQTCTKIGNVTYTNGRHVEYGYGRVNASNAVRRAMVNLAATQTTPGPNSVGNPFSYSIAVTNLGPSREGAVVLSNQLPVNVTLNSATLSQGSYTQQPNNLLVFSLGSLSPGSNATMQLNVTPNAAGTFVNRVTASGKAMDQDPANNASAITNTLGSFTNSVVVYDNTQTFLNIYSPGTNELGDEIVLAPGMERSVVAFECRYFGNNVSPAPGKTAVVRFYLNDGPLSAGFPGPGTLLFESQPVAVVSGSNQMILTLTNPVAVPDRFTWTVQFFGLQTNEFAGPLLYSPPAVGSNFASFWEKTAGVWGRFSFTDGTPPDYGASIRAIPTTRPRLSGLIVSNQTFQIRLSGDPGLRTTLVTSTNLTNWVVLTVVTNQLNATNLISLPIGNEPSRYFRAQTP